MRQIVLIIVGVLMSGVAWGGARSVEQAAMLAQQFADGGENSARRLSEKDHVASVRLAKQYMQEGKQTAALYVFNKANDAGYVIVSGDDRTEDILGYTDSGQFDTTKVNPSLQWWMNRYARQIASLADTVVAMPKTAAATPLIAPLLGGIKWAQEAPYYNKCPKDLGTSSTCMTGCVATAAAQIMKKWQYPAHGTGTHSYTWCESSQCKQLSLNYDTITFDWDNMKTSYKRSYTEVEANAVATLMYACGVACDMEYGSDGSGSYTDDMGYGMVTYFGYSYTKFASAMARSNYYFYAKGQRKIKLDSCKFSCTTSELEAFLNSDLEAGRPVLMGGRDAIFGGHEFVCDGRDSGGKFHINWGWEGSENGYYTLSALGESYDFSDDIDMMVGLRPSTSTAVEECSVEEPIHKWIYQGRLYIECNGQVYDILGQQR